MFTTYEETVNWIHSLLPHGIKPGTKRVEWMMDELGHPERRLRSIHIAGTNGKGSTVSFLRYMLQEGGYRVGTFTSPYIVRFNERISINGGGIPDDELIQVANRIKPLADRLDDTELGPPTEFEVITVMGMLYFAEFAFPDFVLFEVGLGGRFDSTNVIFPLVSVITNIGYDHMAILGNTIEEIAGEKAGIIKSGISVVTAADKPEALQVIRNKSLEKQSKLYALGERFFCEYGDPKTTGEQFSYRSPFAERKELLIEMKGRHQVHNASVALMVIDYLKVYYALVLDEEAIREGLKKTSWPGRFEKVSELPYIILDGAHNPEGMRSLADTVERYFHGKDIRVLFAALENKNIEDMLRPLRSLTDQITFTSFPFKKAASVEKLANRADFQAEGSEPDWKRGLDIVKEDTNENTVIIVTGSLYFISEVRNFFHNK